MPKTDLGLFTSSTNLTFNGSLLPNETYSYAFEVGYGDTIYANFDLFDFQDDLDLKLSKWDAYSRNWNEINVSEAGGTENEFIFKALGSGDYSLEVVSYSDIDNSATASDYTVVLDAETWLSSVTLPNDPLFEKQWHLFNTGQASGIDNSDIWAPEAWAIRTSSPNTTVAVIDSGVEIAHEDLKNNLWVNPFEIPGNNWDDDGNGKKDDVHGWDFINDAPLSLTGTHGTHVAGTIGAEGNNAIGVTGVTWDVNLMCLDVFAGNRGVNPYTVMKAVRYAADNGADVINLSLGLDVNKTVDQYVIENSRIHTDYHDALAYAVNKGSTVVIAAGNKVRNFDEKWLSRPAYLSEYIPGVISVAAVANTGQITSYSNYGSKVTIAAPGGDFNTGGSWKKEDGLLATWTSQGYAYNEGTSMATPVVSGAVALIKEENPNLTPADIEEIIQKSAVNNKDLNGFVRDGSFLDLEQALLLASNWTSTSNSNVEKVYKLYNKENGVHLYTDSYLEKNVATMHADNAFEYEEVIYGALASGGTELYRFHHEDKGYHLYTADAAEADFITGNPGMGYTYEGRSFRVGTSKTEDTPNEVYRFYKRDKGIHYYSYNEIEANDLIAKSLGDGYTLENSQNNNNLLDEGLGYVYEGIAWYAADI